jgi:hypothetical protein
MVRLDHAVVSERASADSLLLPLGRRVFRRSWQYSAPECLSIRQPHDRPPKAISRLSRGFLEAPFAPTLRTEFSTNPPRRLSRSSSGIFRWNGTSVGAACEDAWTPMRGFNQLYTNGRIQEAACWAHVGASSTIFNKRTPRQSPTKFWNESQLCTRSRRTYVAAACIHDPALSARKIAGYSRSGRHPQRAAL